MTRLIYAGIGSRETPESVAPMIRAVARKLESLGWLLHSGGAEGADSFFESGVVDRENARIFLPWQGFNGRESEWHYVCARAHEIARDFHPAYAKLSEGGRLLMGRNSYQVLGPDLDSPVACVVCWTRDGKASGGTGQALRIAAAHDVPVFNLHDPTAAVRLAEFVQGRS
jgi:hypothetical protein